MPSSFEHLWTEVKRLQCLQFLQHFQSMCLYYVFPRCHVAEDKKDQVQNPSGYLKLIWKKGCGFGWILVVKRGISRDPPGLIYLGQYRSVDHRPRYTPKKIHNPQHDAIPKGSLFLFLHAIFHREPESAVSPSGVNKWFGIRDDIISTVCT